MLFEQAILTALPDGVDRERGVARLSAFITLRASGDNGSLGETQYFRIWPDVLSAVLGGLEAEIDNSGRFPVSVVSAPPVPDLWGALFPPSTPITAHEAERWTHRPVATYNARTLHKYAIDVLAGAAAGSPAAPPTAVGLLAGIDDASRTWTNVLDIPLPTQFLGDGPVGTDLRERLAALYSEPIGDRLDEWVRARLANAGAEAAARRTRETGQHLPVDGDYLAATSPTGGNAVQAELARFLVFHHRPEAPPTSLPSTNELAHDLDFHRIQTALGSYRFMLRRLGLAVDLELPLHALQPDPGRVRIAHPGGDLPDLRTPWTAYRRDGPDGRPTFWPAPRPEPVGERVADGMLDLGFGENFSLAQVDVDSAAFKVLNAALAATAHALLPRPVGAPDADAPPALRSTGFALLHDGRAKALHGRLASGHNLLLDLEADGEQATLYAEDVMRGYRLDVLRHGGESWRSLHARRGHYVTVGAAAGVLDEEVDDEGCTQLALGECPRAPGVPADPDATVYLHESLARWEGWSLSAPRPGRALSRSPQAPTEGEPDTQPVEDSNDALPGAVPFEVTFRAQPGSLPRLRVGHGYHVRARAVDLAGNGPTLGDADALLAAIDRVGRPKPVLPLADGPFVFNRFDPLLAPAVVLRRPITEGESVEHVAIRSDHDVASAAYAAATGYDVDADRHVAPAKTSLQDAELMGCFDDAVGSADPAAIDAAYALALRESGRFADAEIWDPEVRAMRPVAGVEQVPPRPDDPASGYVIHREEQLELPYLPDPWSAGAALVGVPGLPEATVAHFGADGSLIQEPDPLPGLPPQPGTLLLDWGGQTPWWRAQPFRLRVIDGDGPPAWDARLRVLTLSLPKAARIDMRLSALPDERRIEDHGPWRALRGVTAPQDAAALVQLARTGRLWALTPSRLLTIVHALQHPLNGPDVLVLRALRVPQATAVILSGEVRIHGASTDRIDLQATWEEWIDEQGVVPTRQSRAAAALTQQIHLAQDTADEPVAPERLESARYIEADDLVVLGAGPRDGVTPAFVSSHEFHDTRHRRITYRVVATSRFREYFRADLVEPAGALTRESEPILVDVPSSAPPPPLHLLYAVPLFGWERETDGRTRTTHRRGGGLRLFLARPWYVSGDAELLGAVLWPSADCPLPAQLEHLVTRWGYDPIWPAAPPPPTPAAQHFRRRVSVGEDLQLLEAPDQRVSVVGHEVEFDPDRDLWTCDLELDLGDAYTPFVRLALARYQPSSVLGAHLSSVATAQIAQVTPERTVTLTTASDDPLLLSVVVSGPAHGPAWQIGGMPSPYGSEVEVYVEERVNEVPDSDLGWRLSPSATVTADHGPPPLGHYVRWSGQVRLPQKRIEGSYRVVIVERERLADDQPPYWDRLQSRQPTIARIVFAETFIV